MCDTTQGGCHGSVRGRNNAGSYFSFEADPLGTQDSTESAWSAFLYGIRLCSIRLSPLRAAGVSLVYWAGLFSWADLVEGLVPQAVASAVQANRDLRSGLPRDYLDYMGAVHSDEVKGRDRGGGREKERAVLLLLLSFVFDYHKGSLANKSVKCGYCTHRCVL